MFDGCPAGTKADNASTNCVSISNGFAWDHGYYAPEIDNTWLGIVGPGVANKGVDGRSAADGPNSADGANSNPKLVTQSDDPGTWGDETDMRPTLLALVGLKDDYVEDGRVLVEDLTNPPDKGGQPKFQRLALCYKQLNSSVGQFGTDLILADTAALKTGSSERRQRRTDVKLARSRRSAPQRDDARDKDQERPVRRRVQQHADPQERIRSQATARTSSARANALAGQG